MKKNVLKIINYALLFLLCILSFLIIHTIFKNNLFQFYKANYIISSIIVLLLSYLTYSTIFREVTIFKIITRVILAGIYGIIFYGMADIIGSVEKFSSNSKINSYTMSLVVRKDSSISNIEDIKELEVLAPLKTDKENIDKLLKNIEDKNKITLDVLDGDSYVKEYDKLITGQNEVIILNSAYENLIELNDPDYKNKIKKVYELNISQEIHQNKEVKNTDVFNVYISGIDTYGPITSVARSDVNIIMTVNRNTGKILLTTTPRDSYVKIAGGGNDEYDKLTHAGVYGIDSSIQTLENLYDIKIDYYTRINFTSFLKLIDVIGGVDVYNDQEFVSLYGNGKYHFPVGTVQLDSDKALGFVRERYSLASGDNDRGKNQQKVITAIIKKLTTTELLKNYRYIIEELSGSIQTDIPTPTIIDLANAQIDSKSEYIVSSQALVGEGVMGLPSYAMPGYNLYMTKISEESLEETKNNIKNVIEGK